MLANFVRRVDLLWEATGLSSGEGSGTVEIGEVTEGERRFAPSMFILSSHIERV